MTIFVDASALVAIMRGEPGAVQLEQRLVQSEQRLTNAIAIWEASRAVGRLIKQADNIALAEVRRYCASLNIATVPIGDAEAAEAVSAHRRYGKGTGHGAKLNMGDCFAYACATTNGAQLLYKGDDFAQTDRA